MPIPDERDPLIEAVANSATKRRPKMSTEFDKLLKEAIREEEPDDCCRDMDALKRVALGHLATFAASFLSRSDFEDAIVREP